MRIERLLVARPARWWWGPVVAGCALTLVLGLGGAAAASSKKHHSTTTTSAPPTRHAVTLHYFVKDVKRLLRSEAGKKLKAGASGAKGDKLEVVQHYYLGDHSSHAKKVGGTGHLSCLYKSATEATCSEAIAIYKGKITANPSLVLVTTPTMSFAINGGSGKYHGALGLITETAVNRTTADVSIVVVTGTG